VQFHKLASWDSIRNDNCFGLKVVGKSWVKLKACRRTCRVKECVHHYIKWHRKVKEIVSSNNSCGMQCTNRCYTWDESQMHSCARVFQERDTGDITSLCIININANDVGVVVLQHKRSTDLVTSQQKLFATNGVGSWSESYRNNYLLPRDGCHQGSQGGHEWCKNLDVRNMQFALQMSPNDLNLEIGRTNNSILEMCIYPHHNRDSGILDILACKIARHK